MSERIPSLSSQQTVDRPIRLADRNQDLVDRSAHGSDEQLLPTLKDGITLLDIDGSRGVQIVQSLVLDHLLFHDGRAFWIDASGHATTTTLARIAPSRRLLDRIHVARGFTAYQHYGAVCDLSRGVVQDVPGRRTEVIKTCRQPPSRDRETPAQSPALIVVPAIDAQYRSDETLPECQAQTLQARMIAQLTTDADRYDCPVLVTRTECDQFTAPVATAADHHLECEQTRMGPRFVGDKFETTVYPVEDGAYYQTTLAYWRQLLQTRARRAGMEPPSPSNPIESPDGVGTGVTADGETTTLTTDPLLDARAGGTENGGR